MEVLHQGTHHLNSCISLNLGKILKPCFFEKPDKFDFSK